MADKPELMTVPCRHEVPDNSGRRYTICKLSWYFLASALRGDSRAKERVRLAVGFSCID